MSNDEVVNELKEKKLPTFGTLVERKDRLKKYYGKLSCDHNSVPLGLGAMQIQTSVNDSTLKDGTNNLLSNLPPPQTANNAAKKSSCLDEIERLKQNREERRKKMDDLRKQKTERELMNEAQGIKVDVDFQVMVESQMRQVPAMKPVRICLLTISAHPGRPTQDLCVRQKEAHLLSRVVRRRH